MIYLLKVYIQFFFAFAACLKTGLLLPSISAQEFTDKIAMLNNPRNICAFGMPIIEPIHKDSSLVHTASSTEMLRCVECFLCCYKIRKLDCKKERVMLVHSLGCFSTLSGGICRGRALW